MPMISTSMITKELMLACRQLGHVLSETLAALVVATVVNPTLGSFYVERAIDENDARVVVEEAAKRILSKEEPGISCLRLQAAYEHEFVELERVAQRRVAEALAAEENIVNWVASFTAQFDQEFNTLTPLYKKIYQFLLLKATGPEGVARVAKNAALEREVAAALESVFPRVGLRSFVALTGAEKIAQLQELAGIVLGIRLWNQHQQKGGVGLPKIAEKMAQLKSVELLDQVQREVDSTTELCGTYVDLIRAWENKDAFAGQWDHFPQEYEVEKARSDLLYHRQYLCYLLNVQEDLVMSLERVQQDHHQLEERMIDLDALVGGRASVAKEQVYPAFDAVAKGYRAAWQEVLALECRGKLHTLLLELKKQYFPTLSPAAEDLVVKFREMKVAGLLGDFIGEEAGDLDALPAPTGSASDGMNGAVRLTVENSPDFLQLSLDFQGYCIHTLVTQDRLLVPGNPALGVMKYAGRFCVFATEKACVEFCNEPDKFFLKVRQMCYGDPELVHLLRVHEDFPHSSLPGILQTTAQATAVMQADAGTETPLHFQESHIDKTYEWNEWKLRREALHMADIKNKRTSTTQTALSHLRRENETQVYLARDSATNTVKNQGTNPPRWRKYTTALRGEPQPMRVVEVKFDL